MVKVVVKGGVWKNTEDEILKAAVMKYGKNQWSRISSLLVRKSAKQCKARWYEWLDPSIKKTEWTRAEEEKLLHLAKIMPSQWRTIAPVVGRTAAQCLEHYERLLDAAQAKEGEAVDPSNDPRRLRPGEIDPNPEGKPARPDPVDMDEDEKEMLSEARARLANTKGKKAKRKAREKQLEEARRLAGLQKKRELRAAGIEIKEFKRKRRRNVAILDYNAEIPFEKAPPPGFYDVTTEKLKTIDYRKDSKSFIGMDIADMEEKRRDEAEEKERKKDVKRHKLHRKTDLPAHILAIARLNDPEQIKRRTKLILPAPQVTDQELETIAKSGPAAFQAVGAGATRTLLSNYNATPRLPTPQRTPRTAITRDHILEETQNLIALNRTETPLKGGENTALHPSDFSGALPKPRTSVPGTPAATPSRPSTGLLVGPGHADTRAPTPMRTPARDELRINPDDEISGRANLSLARAMVAEGAKSDKKRQVAVQKRLQSSLASLPAAQHQYDLVMPELPSEDAEALLKPGEEEVEEDAEDALKRMVREAEDQLQQEISRRSLAVQKNLPRPDKINVAMGDGEEEADLEEEEDEELSEVHDLVEREMLRLLKYDHGKYPLNNEDKDKKGKKKNIPIIENFDDLQLKQARDLITSEVAEIKAERPEIASFLNHRRTELLAQAWDTATAQTAFLPSLNRHGITLKLTKEELLAVERQKFQIVSRHVEDEAATANKLQGKLELLTGGYQQRAVGQYQEMLDLHFEFAEARRDYKCFIALHKQETAAIPRRKKVLREEVETVFAVEQELQAECKKLQQEKEHLTDLLAKHHGQNQAAPQVRVPEPDANPGPVIESKTQTPRRPPPKPIAEKEKEQGTKEVAEGEGEGEADGEEQEQEEREEQRPVPTQQVRKAPVPVEEEFDMDPEAAAIRAEIDEDEF